MFFISLKTNISGKETWGLIYLHRSLSGCWTRLTEESQEHKEERKKEGSTINTKNTPQANDISESLENISVLLFESWLYL